MQENSGVSFTILINNFNYGRFLATAIESSLNQTWHDVQILVVDDGSTDNSLDIANQYESQNYTVMAKPNGGQNSAIAQGLRDAIGLYTIILDSDDWLKPDACEAIARTIGDKRPNGVHFRLEKVDAEGRSLGTYPELPFVLKNHRAYLFRHGTIHVAPTSGNAYRTDFLKEAFAHVRPGSFSSDGYLSMAAAATDQVVVLDDILGTYLVHGQNISQKTATDDVSRRKKNNDYTLDHYRHLHKYLVSRGDYHGEWFEMINSYTWRRIIFFKIFYGLYEELSYRQCKQYGVKKFVIATHYGVLKQMKGVILVWLGSTLGQIRNVLSRRT